MTQYVANQRKSLVPLELLIHQVPPLSQQHERLMPIEISQAFAMAVPPPRSPATTLSKI